MRTTAQQQQLTEQRIRAAMDRLLRGELTANGGCDIKTLAAQANVTRSALYSTYQHLRVEFEQRREHLHSNGSVTDHRLQQITTLKQQVTTQQTRLTDRDRTINELTAFRTSALSRLAAQHDEIRHLRTQLQQLTTQRGNVRLLRPIETGTENGSR